MDGFCIKLLYVVFAQCFINTGNMKMCGPEVKDFRPIYTLEMCNECSNSNFDMITETTTPTCPDRIKF